MNSNVALLAGIAPAIRYANSRPWLEEVVKTVRRAESEPLSRQERATLVAVVVSCEERLGDLELAAGERGANA